MDHYVASLSYQGSIVEAIVEAKRQKKLLVVYISGDNAESRQLEESTWTSSIVADTILKYCILLHISEGSTDAANFSAIYPQKSAPCITAVGYNGVQLLQNDGFIDAETLATNLQKAWLSLHLQETLLTAALASENSTSQLANSSVSSTREQGDSSGVNIASPSVDGLEIESHESLKHPDKDQKEMDINLGKKPSPEPVSANTLSDCKDEVAASVEKSKASVSPDKSDVNIIELGDKSIDYKDEVATSIKSKASLTPSKLDANSNELGDKAIEDKRDNVVHNEKIKSEIKTENSQGSVGAETEGSLVRKVDEVQDDRANEPETVNKSTDVHLNIRLFDGATLQNKFLLTSTLRMVKHYVDENQTTVRGSYDLAIPYPRKVFKDQDLDQTLSELGLVGRQALIVIRCDQVSSSSRTQTSVTSDIDSPNSNTGGYFSYLKWIISYANPLSYLGGGARSSNPAQETPGDVSQYGPRAGLWSNLRGTGATSSSNQSSNSSKKATPRFGSNIHTLKHDDEDDKSSDRNKFWNGNSTQYGGDDDRK